MWIPDTDTAINRVRERVLHGGHSIPEDVIIRRYSAGLKNVFSLYLPLANTWALIDNSNYEISSLIAEGSLSVQKEGLWKLLKTNGLEA